MNKLTPTFHQIIPEDVWTPPGKNRQEPVTPSGCPFMDRLATIARTHGHADAKTYARMMGVEYIAFIRGVEAVTGLTANRWIEDFMMLDVRWMLLHTMLNVKVIATRCNFGQGDNLARTFRKRFGQSPLQFRASHRRVRTRVVNDIEIIT